MSAPAIREIHYAPTAQSIQHDRAVRMTQVVAKFASTLCQREVRTRLVEQGVAPAWSTSNTITFVESDLADLGTVEGVLSSKGLSLHEVSHILFTPRSGSDIVRWVIANKLGRAFNALEDQRIETLMVGRFGSPIVPWLTAVVAQHLVGKPEQLQTAFPLIRGRKYLPVELRRACRDLYLDQTNVDELSDIIDEYRTLLFPEDTERAQALIARYGELVKELPQAEGGCSDKSPDAYDSNGDSRPLGKKAQQSAQRKAEERDEQDEADADPFDFGDPADNDWDDEDESDASGSDSDSDESDSSDGASDGDAGDADADADGDQPAGGDLAEKSIEDILEDIKQAHADKLAREGESADGQGDSAGQNGSDKVADLLNDILDEVTNTLSDELSKEIAQFNGETELNGNNTPTPKLAQVEMGTVDPRVAQASKSFGLELERLRAQFDPGWEREVSSGRISTSRYLRGAKLEESFDRWSIGREDAVDIEAVILLDSSGSMQGEREQRASGAMWGLKRALDKVGASCTVVSFSTPGWGGGDQLVYKADEPAGSTVKRVPPSGGTDPSSSLKYATRIFAESDRAIKVLFTVTDGEWSNAEVCEESIKNLRRAGVLTALAYIAESPSADVNPHESEVVSHIANASDLFMLGRQLVKVATKRNLSN